MNRPAAVGQRPGGARDDQVVHPVLTTTRITATTRTPEQREVSRARIVKAINDALDREDGFAVGKIGFAEQALLSLPTWQSATTSAAQRAAIWGLVRMQARRQLGLFPSTDAALANFADLHAHALAELNIVGLFGTEAESAILDSIGFAGLGVPFWDVEPSFAVPAESEPCLVSALRARRVLLVSSFAELLAERADKRTFEAVWAKSSRSWFEPLSVEALEFPFAYDERTQNRFGSSQELLQWIIGRIDPERFDVALIAGAGLGIPIAAAVKGMGRVAIALGGSLQVLFGVLGARWREDPGWMQTLVTPAWIDMPERYLPRSPWGLVDDGAYW